VHELSLYNIDFQPLYAQFYHSIATVLYSVSGARLWHYAL